MKKVSFTYCALCIFNLLCLFSHGQQRKDTILLSEVSVTDYRSKSASENFSGVKIDSATRSNFSNSSMPQLLLQQNACFVKSYGPANIASLSIRGSSAQQTAVIWNGMNINNPMLGQADISLLPVGFFNSISLQKGALSGYWGSGATAGALNLQSATKNDSGFVGRASISYSTLQNVVNWAAVNFSDGAGSSSTRILSDASKNQYDYFLNDSSIAKQKHAATRQHAVLQDWNVKLDQKQQLGMHFWWQEAQRQVPNTLSDLKQNADQQDKIFRAMLDWKLDQKNYSVLAKTAFFNESLIYNNTTYGIFSKSNFKTFMADLEGHIYLPKGFAITGGSTNSMSSGSSDGYAGQKQISRMALFENFSWKNGRVQTNIYAREELFNFNTFVPTAGFTSSTSIFRFLTWKINAGTVYRYPTLNDLYWNPGGNLNLKPEQGYSAETSLNADHQIKNFYFSLSGTFFNRDIHNCIVWLPGKNGVWSPQNILQMWSRGAETNSEITFRNRNLKTSVNVITNYVLSSRTQTALQNDASVNRQMPYVPMYSGSAIFSFEYKNWMLGLAYAYTGYRYLTTDNYNYLVPFRVLDARIARTFVMKNLLLNIFVEGNNLLNENYQSVSQYPMPLRNFKAGIILQYQRIKNKNQ